MISYKHFQRSLLLLLLFSVISNNVNANSPDCFNNSDCKQQISDPLEKINRVVFSMNEFFDYWLLKPIAIGYKKIPKVITNRVTDFFYNLYEPVTIVNAALQGKTDKVHKSYTRLILNSVLGLGGLFDVSKKLGISREQEDFGQTLAYWGVGTGPYLVLPFLGPRSLRNTSSLMIDSQLKLSQIYADNLTTLQKYSLLSLEAVKGRSSFLDIEDAVLEGASDKYTLYKSIYFQNRKFKIYEGQRTNDKQVEEIDEELDSMLD